MQPTHCNMKPILPAPAKIKDCDLKGKRLLVIDDEESMLTAVSKVLRHAGGEVKTATGFAEAIMLLSEKDAGFDAVLTDLRMPLASGKSILGLMKTTYPEVPVLIMSAYWTDELKAECKYIGTDRFINKPVQAAQLLDCVFKAVNGVEHSDIVPLES